MIPKNKPRTHIAWSQLREHGRFREWYRSGHGWLETTPEGEAIVCAFHAAHVRGDEGYVWLFPVGKTPPDPSAADEGPKRPDMPDEDF